MIRLVAVVLLTACGGATPRLPQSPEEQGRELLARHLRWRGTVAGPVVMEGDAALGEQPAKITLTVAAGGAFRQVLDLGGASTTTVVGPDGAFLVNLSGSVETLGEHERRSAVRDVALRIGRDLGAGTVTAAGKEERDGKGWDVVKVVQGPDAYELFLDASGALTWVRVTEDNETSWQKFGGWSGGVPRSEEGYDSAGKLESRVTWTRVDTSVAPAAALFKKPEGRGLAITYAGGVAATPWIPFEVRNEKIIVAGSAGGHPCEVLLDSGAGISVIDTSQAKALGLPRVGSINLAGTSATQVADLVGPLVLQLGPVTVAGVTAVAVDLGIVGDGGAALPIILGKELFGNAVVEVDFPGRRLRFHEPARYVSDGRGVALPVVLMAGGLIAVELSVEGRPPALFGVDTGGSGALDVFSWYAEENGLLAGKKTALRKAGGVGGTYLEKTAILSTVTLAGQTFTGVPAAFPDVKEGAFATRRVAGNLDAGLLARFRLVFHYAAGVLVFEAGDVKRPFAKDRAGLQFEVRADALELVYVVPGSPGAAAGWKEHDRITRIDGQKIAGLPREATRAWTTKPAGTRVVLVDGAGKSRPLILADYF